MKTWFNLSKREDSTLAVYIYDVIDSFWGQSAKDFVQEVNAHDGIETIELHLNSPGGSVFDGFAIYNFLKNHAAKVVVFVDGMAASIASVIAMAGDTVNIPKNAYLMIHDPWLYTTGNAAELQKDIDFLDKLTGSIISIYAAKTGIDRDELAQMMADETWLDGKDAKEKGFADVLSDAVEVAAKFELSTHFDKAPEAALQLLQNSNEQDNNEPEDQPEEQEAEQPEEQPEDTRAEFKKFVARFGNLATDYFVEGLSYEDAFEKYVQHLEAENQKLKTQVASDVGTVAVEADPAGDEPEVGSLWKQYNAIKDPNGRTAFWNKHEQELRAEQRALNGNERK